MTDQINKSVKIYHPTEKIPFGIVAEANDYHCDFKCYESVAFSGDAEGGYTVPEYHLKDYDSGMDITRDLELAQVYLHGSIKWDGCANLYFDEQDNVMLHFCGRRSAAQIGALLDRLYDIAAESIAKWDEECAA